MSKKVFNTIKLHWVVCFAILTAEATAQQTAQFNTYSYDLMQLNIAAIGRTCVEANLNYRNQWTGIEQTPKFYQLNAGMELGKSNGIGLKASQQTIGLFRVTNATFGYAYKVKINETSKIHLGLGAGWQQSMFASNKAVVLDNNDVSLATNQSQQRSNNFNVEAGALFLSDKLTAGVSSLNLYNSNTSYGSIAYKVKPQINVVLSYVFNKGKTVEIQPWIVNRYTINGKNQPEGIINLRFKQLITVGGGYRLNYGFLTLIGLELSKCRVAYSFDYGVGKQAISLGGSHQILLGIDLCQKKFKKPEPIVDTPPAPPVKEEPIVKKEEPVVVKQQEPVKPVTPTIDPEAERLKREEAALQQINLICTGLNFESGKTALAPTKSTDLDKIAKLIKDNNLSVTIKGFASKDGNPAINARLCKLRADNVRNELIKRGVNQLSLNSAAANGQELNEESDETAKEKNRSVRITRLNK